MRSAAAEGGGVLGVLQDQEGVAARPLLILLRAAGPWLRRRPWAGGACYRRSPPGLAEGS